MLTLSLSWQKSPKTCKGPNGRRGNKPSVCLHTVLLGKRTFPNSPRQLSHTVTMKKGNSDCYFYAHFVFLPLLPKSFTCLSAHKYLQLQSKEKICFQRHSTDHSCRSLISKKDGHLEDLRNYCRTKRQTSRLRCVCSSVHLEIPSSIKESD